MTFTTAATTLLSGHVAGIPIEETLGTIGPALLVVVAITLTTLRVRIRRMRRAISRTHLVPSDRQPGERERASR
jgi:hypothetical protein